MDGLISRQVTRGDRMSLRKEQCNKVCHILDDVLANRPTERNSLIVTVRKAFEALKVFGNSEQLPSTQPEQRWIPCSRRLPDDLAEVNVTYVNHDPEPYYVFTKDKPSTASAVYYKGNWYWYSSTCADYLCEYGRNDVDKVDDAIEITAWKPLPEPYRGEQNED